MKLGTVGWAVLIGAVALGATIWVGSYYGAIPEGDASTDIVESKHDYPPISPNPPYPAVYVEGGTTFPFGMMPPGGRNEHVFVIKNNGEAPLILRQGSTTCKCTISEFAGKEIVTDPDAPKSDQKAEATIAPGGQIEVKLSWKTERPSEMFRQSAAFYTNDPQHKDLKLYVSGKVVEEVSMAPTEEWQVGPVPEDKPATIDCYLFSQMFDHFEIEKIESSSDQITAKVSPVDAEELKRRKVNSAYKVTVTVEPQIPLGPFKETLKFTTHAGDRQRELEIPVTGFRPGPFRILPVAGVAWEQEKSLLDFGTLSQNSRTFAFPFFVTDAGNEELKIVDFESDVPDLQVRLETETDEAAEGKRQYRLVIEFPSQPINRNTPPFGKVTVKTNHPAAPELTLFLKFLSL